MLEIYLPYAPIAAEVQAGAGGCTGTSSSGWPRSTWCWSASALTTTRRLRQSARRNAYLAEHDPLTDLPNRRAFLRELEPHRR